MAERSRNLQRCLAADGDLWVFAYGSLMWRPGFAFAEVARARVTGFSRRFCVASVHHRGSPARPGLVLGLDSGGVCEGIVYRVPAERAAATVAYLREREQVNGVYREVRVPVEIEGDRARTVDAIAYLVERSHPSYVARLPLRSQAGLIVGARGISGVNLDYLVNTMRQIAALGIRERELERLLVVIGGLFSRPCAAAARSPATAAGPASARAEALRRAHQCRLPVVRCIKRMRPGDRRRFGYRKNFAVV
jgi:cation transport protein ChaC